MTSELRKNYLKQHFPADLGPKPKFAFASNAVLLLGLLEDVRNVNTNSSPKL